MTIKKVFPTLIYSDSLITNKQKLKKLCSDLKTDCYKIRNSDQAGQEWSAEHLPGAYTSYESISSLHEVSTLFMKMRKHIDKHVQSFAQELGFDPQAGPLKMQSCWINILGPKAYHGLHLHPLSAISGTLYLQTPKNSGSLKLEDPRLSKMMTAPPKREKLNLAQQNFLYYTAQPGKLVLFESWLRHEVEQNLSLQDRVSISFNYHL